jgi:hypothetical protein
LSLNSRISRTRSVGLWIMRISGREGRAPVGLGRARASGRAPRPAGPGVRGLEGDAGRRGTIETDNNSRFPGVPRPSCRVRPRSAGRLRVAAPSRHTGPARHRRRAASRSLRRAPSGPGSGSRGPAPLSRPTPPDRNRKAREEIGRRSPSPVRRPRRDSPDESPDAGPPPLRRPVPVHGGPSLQGSAGV